MMQHLGDGLYVGRYDDAGTVRLLKLNYVPLEGPNVYGTYADDAVLDVNVTAANWAAAVAAVSKRGDIEGRHYAALAFHNNAESSGHYTGVMPQRLIETP